MSLVISDFNCVVDHWLSKFIILFGINVHWSSMQLQFKNFTVRKDNEGERMKNVKWCLKTNNMFFCIMRNLIPRGNKVNWEDIIKWWESLEVDTSMNEFNVNCGKLTEICYLLWRSSVNWTIQWILFPNIPASLFIVWDIISFYDKMQWKNAMIKCNVLLILILIDTNKIFAAKYFCV